MGDKTQGNQRISPRGQTHNYQVFQKERAERAVGRQLIREKFLRMEENEHPVQQEQYKQINK